MKTLDTISSLSSAITMITKNVLGLSITIISYKWIEERIALTHINSTLLTYIIAFVVLDFLIIGSIELNIQIIFSGTAISSITAVKNLTWHVQCDNPFPLL